MPVFAWHVLLISLIFLKRSLGFLFLLFSSISLHWWLRKAFLFLLAILWKSAFRWIYLSFSLFPFASLLFLAICKASSDNHFSFLHFFFLRMVFYCCLLYSVIREGDGTPLQYSCLENPMDGGAWWAAVHGVARSWTQLSDFPFPFHFHALEKEMATHFSVLAWRIPRTAEPGGLPSMGSLRVGHDWSDLAAAVQCYEPPCIILQALCLSDLIPWICSSLPLHNHKGFELGHTWMV